MEIIFIKIVLKCDHAKWLGFLFGMLLFGKLYLILDIFNVVFEILKLLLLL